mgnify:CR=1 FL=1
MYFSLVYKGLLLDRTLVDSKEKVICVGIGDLSPVKGIHLGFFGRFETLYTALGKRAAVADLEIIEFADDSQMLKKLERSILEPKMSVFEKILSILNNWTCLNKSHA